MPMNRLLALAALLLWSTSPAPATEVPQADFAARTELHPIHTLTLADKQFLTGDQNAKEPTTTGQLRIAQGSGRLPVVVLQHGSGGMGANIELWTKEFNAMGISTFALDGFTGRGLTEVSTNQALLGRLNFILDIYRALDVLARHPRVDPQRVVLMGFSRGGQAALYASLKRFHQMWNKSGIEFAGYNAFYPDCATTFLSDTMVADRPIRIFGGTPDDYNPIGRCKPYVERLKAAGHDVVLTEYPNAPHSFDNPLGAIPAVVSSKSESVRNCTIKEEPVGRLINSTSGEIFTYSDPCVVHGPHIGYDPEATAQVRQAVKALMHQMLEAK
jgi:dienelactone hydrolase